jgi:hypothetical protein
LYAHYTFLSRLTPMRFVSRRVDLSSVYSYITACQIRSSSTSLKNHCIAHLNHHAHAIHQRKQASQSREHNPSSNQTQMATRVSFAALLCSIAATATHLHHSSSTSPVPSGSLSATPSKMDSASPPTVQQSLARFAIPMLSTLYLFSHGTRHLILQPSTLAF